MNLPKASGKRFRRSGWSSASVRLLGVTASLKNGIGMGLATTFVLVCSNVLISHAA